MTSISESFTRIKKGYKRITVDIPEKLKAKIVSRAKVRKQSIKAVVTECLVTSLGR